MTAFQPGVPIHQHWSGSKILLSYLISVTGSYCTIQLMEQWRRLEGNMKLLMLMFAAVTLGGCGIWCTHFTGMTALELTLEDGTILVVDFEVGLTIVSFIFPVVGVFIGLTIASRDPFFLEIEQDRRKDMLVANLKKVKMSVAVKKQQIMALFSRLWHTAFGGAFAALGVLGMHYLGMMAQRTNAVMTFDAGVVSLSVVIAFVTANAAFWIIFRALTFLPNNEWLRLGSALIMGIAVCGTHYSGMGAASYTVSEEHYVRTSQFVVDGREAAVAASHGALLVCYWLLSFSVVRIARKRELVQGQGKVTTQHDSGANNPHTTLNTIHSNNLVTTKTMEIQHQGSAGSVIRKVYIAPDESETMQLEQIT
ncbi:putative signaling protein [Globisporangium polare]